MQTERNYKYKKIELELVADPIDFGSVGEFYCVQNWSRVECAVSEGSDLSNIGVFNPIVVNPLVGVLQRRLMCEEKGKTGSE